MPAGAGSHGKGPGQQPYMRPARAPSPAPPPRPKLPPLTKKLTLSHRARVWLWSGAGAAIVATTLFVLYGTPTSCRRGSARRAAVSLLAKTQDKVTGEPLSERFPRGDFRCAALPRESGLGGILVEAKDGEDPVTWYFDAAGKPHNVNQLAWAWTPDFPEAPRITDEQLAAVRE